ncbi:MAG TPA: PEP-CTERM sorting domain-containing protein [Haloferula sp.]
MKLICWFIGTSAALCLLIAPASAAVIDLFDQRDQAVSTNNLGLPTSSTETISGSQFSSRKMSVTFGGGNFTTSTITGTLSYEAIIPDSSSNRWGYFSLVYSSADLVNLIGAGENSFRLVFDQINVLSGLPLSFSVASGSATRSVSLPGGFSESGSVVDIPFTSFQGVDFSKVSGITLSASRLSPGTSFTLNSITTVPEPGMLTLLSAASLFVFRRRR